ncbi:MAG: hypothetical protein J6B71_10950, partial [Clostridia bacterium]|nr:hypothetical protein [Clostridia bacterium]
MKKRILSLFLTTVMILSTLVIIPVSAAEAENTFVYDEDTYASTDEFTITTWEDLDAFDKVIESGVYFSGKTVKLAGDITLPSDFGGIGINNDGAKGFGGIFYGQGHTITMSGHTLVNEWEGQLFVFTQDGGNSATIKDLNVDGTMNIQQKNYGSVLIGRPLTKEVIIENVHISVDVYCEKQVQCFGAFISNLRGATQYNNITIKGCIYDGTVAFNAITDLNGGFIGNVQNGDGAKNITIQDCVYAGTMAFNADGMCDGNGLFIGQIQANTGEKINVEIKDCYSI